MTVQKIDGYNIYNYFISGAHNLIRWEQNLNRINVFPVPDGDTGTNLAMTMRTIITEAKKHDSLSASLNSMSQIAVENAYGNSGMIFAQYLSGFAEEAGRRDHVTAAEFGDIAAAAARHAYEAVVHPKEGTILSVMKGWAAELRNSLASGDFEQSISDSVDKARHMVQQTREKMKVLRDAGVVDAGAKGFLIFLEGMLAYLKSGRILESEQAAQEELKAHVNLVPQADVLQNRFCTQLYIESKRSRQQIAESIDALGDSLVVAHRGSNYSIHIHTDHPETVMDRLAHTDTVRSHRVEDMKRQRDMVHERRHSIAIVTDSIADLPRAFADEQQISVIPIRLICDGVVYLDKVTMTPELFYRRMPEYRMNPTSAQPPISDFEETFEKLLPHYDSIIGIFVSSKMSGTVRQRVQGCGKESGRQKDIGDRLSCCRTLRHRGCWCAGPQNCAAKGARTTRSWMRSTRSMRSQSQAHAYLCKPAGSFEYDPGRADIENDGVYTGRAEAEAGDLDRRRKAKAACIKRR